MIQGRIRQVKPKGASLVFQFNPEAIVEQPSVAVFDEIERPRDKPILEYRSRSAARLQMTVIFDRFETGESVEQHLRTLENFARPVSKRKPPPELEFDYGPVGRGKRWVLTEVTYGDESRDEELRRTYAVVTITLTEFIDVEISLTPAKRNKGKKNDGDKDKKGKRSSGKRVVTGTGDTLARIASVELGDHLRWVEIAELNGIRDPNHLTPGQSLQLPEE